ncbi:MAG: hypothetical protein ACK4Q4_08355 [Rhodocyclaceae bacterium]
MFHPASLLLSWLAFALGLQWLDVFWLMSAAVICVMFALMLAPGRTRALLWRSRWLLLSLAILYSFATPGEYLPGLWGAFGLTEEGVEQGAEQIGRLLAMLASLALLHWRLGTSGLLAALYWLLRPFAWRDKSVVRLMLVLEAVERQRKIPWREWLTPASHEEPTLPARLTLTLPRFHVIDAGLSLVLAILLIVSLFGR